MSMEESHEVHNNSREIESLRTSLNAVYIDVIKNAVLKSNFHLKQNTIWVLVGDLYCMALHSYFLNIYYSMILFTMIALEKTKKRTNQRLEVPSMSSIIDAICINCNKQFKSMHAVSIDLRVTARRHSVNFINYGIYDKRTGLKEMNHPKLNFKDFRHIRKANSTTFTHQIP